MGKNALLFVNLNKKKSQSVSESVKTELEKRKFDVTVFLFDGKPEKVPSGKWDIAFSLGGDGTVLYTARCLAPLNVPILPVNLGSLGFIAGVNSSDWLDVFNKWESGGVSISRRCMLEISVERDSQIIMKNVCLNDVVITAGGIAKLINLDVHINSNEGFVSLGSYRCDGLIIATPTGSSAYSMAAGGPIVDPEMEAVILNPICPFTLSNRPFVLPSNQKLAITVTNKQRTSILLTVDGQDIFDLEAADKIFIKQAPFPALLIYTGMNSYYSVLRTKLFGFTSFSDTDSSALAVTGAGVKTSGSADA
jgi:NAD+ kinase